MKTILLTLAIFLIIGVFNKANSQTKSEVRIEIAKYRIKYPKIVLAQSLLETGYYNCERCSMRYNNLFGFRLPSQVTEENPLGYLKFESWSESIKYYKGFQKRHFHHDDYFEFLIDRHYAHDMDKYVSDLKWIIKRI